MGLCHPGRRHGRGANGPNGRPCANGALQVDGAPFDQSFTCDCNATRFTGDNCQVPREADNDLDTGIIVLIVVLTVLTITLSTTVLCVRRQHALKKARLLWEVHDFRLELLRLRQAGELHTRSGGADLVDLVPRELKRGDITIGAVLGNGAFGQVCKATLDESKAAGGVPEYLVAVKMAHSKTAHDELIREGAIMAQCPSHPNLVSLIGVVTSGEPLLLVVQFCEGGELLAHLKEQHKADVPVTAVHEKLRMALDVVRGMTHLAAHGFVHRDLAARNVLLSSGLLCKVADFGLSRSCASSGTQDGSPESDYYRSQGGVVPIRWTAPEAFFEGRFTQASDVWAFAITLTELFSNGARPYPATSNEELLRLLEQGYRHPAPAGCPQAVHTIMLECWARSPSDRPSFAELGALLEVVHVDAQAGELPTVVASPGMLQPGSLAPTASRALLPGEYATRVASKRVPEPSRPEHTVLETSEGASHAGPSGDNTYVDFGRQSSPQAGGPRTGPRVMQMDANGQFVLTGSTCSLDSRGSVEKPAPAVAQGVRAVPVLTTQHSDDYLPTAVWSPGETHAAPGLPECGVPFPSGASHVTEL